MMFPGIPVILGTAEMGSAIATRAAMAVLDAYASLGGRVLDTANNYAFWHPGATGGESETVLGNWLEQRDRHAFTVMTKIGSLPVRTATGFGDLEGLAPDAIRRAARDSRARLKTDCLDLLLAHHDDPKTPLLDMWAAFTELVAAGHVKHVGISNFQPHRVMELAELIRQHSLAPVAVVQLQYSLIQPATTAGLGKLVLLDQDMVATLKAHLPGAAVVGYSPLLNGLFEKDPAAAWPPAYESPENRRTVARVQQDAQAGGISPSAQVLKLSVAQGVLPVTATGKVERLQQNLAPFAF